VGNRSSLYPKSEYVSNFGFLSPGRFFAVNELKAFVAHVLLTYDVKAEKEGGSKAKMFWFGPVAAQDNSVKYLFRKRRV